MKKKIHISLFLLIYLSGINLSVGQNASTNTTQFLGYQIQDNKNKAVIPFEVHNNLIVIPVILNGNFPLKFILDTGVRTAILMDKRISDFFNISYSRSIKIIGAAGGEGVLAHVAPNISLGLPGVSGAGQSLLVMDEDYLKMGETIGTEVHGIIGYELFSRFVMEISYSKNTLTLYEPSAFKKVKRHKEIPIRIEDTKPYLFTTINIGNNTRLNSKLLIDTGASHSLLLHVDSHEDIVLPAKTISTSLGRGLGGNIEGEIGRVSEIRIFDYKLYNTITSFPESAAYIDVIANSGRNGSIGGGILNRFDVTFDYSKEKMYIIKNSDFRRKSNYNMSGIELKAEGPRYKKFVVIEVLEASPAEAAGIEVGDEIIMMNGVKNDNLTINYINNVFKYKPNKKLKLRIKRNGTILKKSFRLRKII